MAPIRALVPGAWGPRGVLLVAVLVAAAALRAAFLLQSAPVDDAYITYRYARNLAEGVGFAFNAGERVLGTTTPLFTLMLVPFAAAGLPLDRVGPLIGLLADLGTLVVLYAWLRRDHGPETALVAALFHALFYASAGSIGYGMEAPVFSFFVAAGFYATGRGRAGWAGALGGLAALTRPEGVVAVLLSAAFLRPSPLRGRLRGWARGAAFFLAVVLPWVVYATLWFGSPVPQSLIAKSKQSGIGFDEWIGFFFLRNPLVLLLWGLAVLGAIEGLRRRSHAVAVLAAWSAAYALFFLVGRPPFLGLWYFPPLTWALAGLAAIGAVAAASVCIHRGREVRSPARGALAVGAGFAVLSAAVLPRTFASARWSREIAETVYRPMGHWVQAHTTPEAVVHVSDIGYVGYLSGRRILDASALVSPEVLAYARAHPENRSADVAFVLERRPELVLLPLARDVYSRFRAGGFGEVYTPVRRFQALGETDLEPAEDPGPAYERSSRYVPDFIAYRLRGSESSEPR